MREAVDEVRCGRSLLVRTNGLTSVDPLAQIARVLCDGGYESHEVDVAGSGNPAVRVARALGISEVQGTSVGELFSNEEFRRSPLFLVYLNESRYRDWFDFLAAFELRARSVDAHDRARFLIRLSSNGEEIPRVIGDSQVVVQRQWNGITSELDTMISIARRVVGRELKPYQRRLLVSWVSHLALWDTELAELLLSLPEQRLATPLESLREYGRSQGWSDRKVSSWLDGTRNQYEGSERRHSAWLALHDRGNELEQRMWAAQAAVLLPLLDQHRRALIRESIAYIKPALARKGSAEDLLDVEFNELHNALVQVRAPKSLQEKGRRLREHRNCLAHQLALPFEQLFFSNLLDPPSDDSHLA